MNWLEKMRKKQRALANKHATPLVNELLKNLPNTPDANEYRRGFKEDWAMSDTEYIEKLSWHLARKAFSHPDFSKKNSLKVISLGCDIDRLSEDAADFGPNTSLKKAGVMTIRNLLKWLMKCGYNLPNVGKLIQKDGQLHLVLDRKGLKKMQALAELETEIMSEAEARKQDPHMPGPRRLRVSPFDDDENK